MNLGDRGTTSTLFELVGTHEQPISRCDACLQGIFLKWTRLHLCEIVYVSRVKCTGEVSYP